MQANPVSPFRRRTALASLVVAGALALAGCAALQPKTPEQVVAERVEQRWAALIKGDFEKAWTYTQPAYRDIVKQADYRKRFSGAGQWRGVQVHEVNCEAERCQVRIRLTSRITIPPVRNQDVTGALEETWVRDEGRWWYYQSF